MTTQTAAWVRIPAVDDRARERALRRLDRLTKPLGSLGRLEALAAQLAAIQGSEQPAVGDKVIVTMAADHGVAQEGVSAYPQSVTAQMVLNFLQGGAGINVLARQAGARIVVVDMGVAAELPPHRDLLVRRVGPGTRNMAQGPAMTREQAEQALEAGIAIAREQAAAGALLIGTGDMGIGNTTASSAIVACLLRLPIDRATGRGTGVDDAAYSRKLVTIERALAVNRPDPADPLDVLAKVGGFEIAGLAGVILGAASAGRAVVLDGFIAGAAALVAAAVQPAVRPYLLASHRSQEPGHRLILEHLGLEPLLDLRLRLGEGTGAALAMPLIDAAARILTEMATFQQAGVSERTTP